MIRNITVMGAASGGGRLGRESGGGEIQGPEDHSGGVKVYTPGGQDAADFGPVARKVAARVWDAPAEDKGYGVVPEPCCGGGCGRQGDGGSRRVRERRLHGSAGRWKGSGGRYE